MRQPRPFCCEEAQTSIGNAVNYSTSGTPVAGEGIWNAFCVPTRAKSRLARAASDTPQHDDRVTPHETGREPSSSSEEGRE